MRLEYFQMIDEVLALDAGNAIIVARSRVPRQSPVFEGHFPGHPLVPGVLLIETMAQACGYLLLALNGFDRLPLLASVRDAKLRTPVKPRCELMIEAAREHDGSGFAVMNARIRNRGSPVCDAVLNMTMTSFPSQELRRQLLASAKCAGLFAMEA